MLTSRAGKHFDFVAPGSIASLSAAFASKTDRYFKVTMSEMCHKPGCKKRRINRLPNLPARGRLAGSRNRVPNLL